FQVHQGLQWETVVWAFRTTTFGNWLPLTWLTHLLDYQLYGPNAGGHHFSSLVIHVINTVLLFGLLNRLTGAIWKSGLVAALFAVHPLNVESVAWIAERKIILCTVFWLLNIWAYSWYAAKPGWKRYVVTLAVFGLGLMAKSMVVTLPFVLMLLDYWPLRRLGRTDERTEHAIDGNGQEVVWSGIRAGAILRLALEKVPFVIMAAMVGVITLNLQRDLGTVSGIRFSIRAENAIVSYFAYLEKALWPAKLAVLYPHPKSFLSGFRVGIAALVLLAISVAVISAFRRYKYLGVGWLWFLGALVPV